MKVFNNTHLNYHEDPIRFWDFEKFQETSNDVELYIGCQPSDHIKEPNGKKKIFFSTEEQNSTTDSTDIYLPFVDQIATICPPSVTGRQKRISSFFPLNEIYVPEICHTRDIHNNKKFDTCYTGLAAPSHLQEILGAMTKFNYCFASFHNTTGKATHLNVSYKDKLKLISESKCCVVHNLVNDDNPQLKSRTFEAAFCKSLILCKKDKFNIIEEWFEPNIDFLYWKEQDDLALLIELVNNDYNFYKGFVENAYKKAMNNYTTKHWIEKYIGVKQ